MNGVCGSCGKPEHPDGCKLGPASPQEQVKLDQHSRVSDPKNTCGICMAADHATPACPKATYVDPEWFLSTIGEMKARTEAALKALGVENKIKLDVSHLHPQMIDLLVECIEVQRVKGGDYTQKSKDRLTNFKRAAQKWGITIEQSWGVLYGKHADAVETYVKHGQVESEPIRGRIVDCINYLLLLWLIVREKDPEAP